MSAYSSSRALIAAGVFLALSAPIAGAQGALDVDPEAAERALERTLVLEGSTLLPPGSFETVGALTYDYSDIERLGGLERTRRDRITGRLELRYGLPFDSQVELRLPYNRVRERVDTLLPSTSARETGMGVGDFSVGLAKTLFRESGARPDLVLRVTYDSASGKDSDAGVVLTSDTEEVELSLVALKRLDPIALSGRIGFERTLETGGIDFGDSVNLGLNASLAASPVTSISLGLNATWSEEVRVSGITLGGTDTNQATMTFGVSTVLGRNTLGNVSFGAGLTEDSPDYFLSLSVSRRFGGR